MSVYYFLIGLMTRNGDALYPMVLDPFTTVFIPEDNSRKLLNQPDMQSLTIGCAGWWGGPSVFPDSGFFQILNLVHIRVVGRSKRFPRIAGFPGIVEGNIK